MYSDNNFENKITAINASYFFPSEERQELEENLSSHKIELIFCEQRGAQASLFDTIVFYINEHLTELFVCSLLAPAAYDAVKTTILSISKRIAGRIGNE